MSAPRVSHLRPLAPEEPGTDALGACVEVFRRWLELPDPGALFVTLATIAANRQPGDPVWTLLVGPPGSGKTETLGPLTGLADCHPAATLTAASLLSGTPRKDRADGSKGGLLRVIGDYGIIVLKDFGSILSMHRDARADLLAGLREIYDGAWTRHVGSDGGRTLHWEGKVGLVAGCTPAIDSHHSVMGSMGERFVLYRLPAVDGAAQVRRALARGNRDAEMRTELAHATRTVLDDATDHAYPLDDDATDRLVALAELAARCRSSVERDGYSREIELIPEPEAPARVALVLSRLLDGLTAIGVPPGCAWPIAVKVGLDSMPAIRRSVLEHLLAADRPLTTKDTGEALGYPTTTARRALEDLAAHGITSRDGTAGKADLYAVTDWCRTRWSAVAVPETSDDPC